MPGTPYVFGTHSTIVAMSFFITTLFVASYHWLTIMTECQTEKIYNHETSLLMQNTGAHTV